MKGYSKINLLNSNTKSRSMDFLGQTIPNPIIQKPISINKSTQQPNNPDHNHDDDDDDYKQYSSGNHQEEEDGKFPMKMLPINHSSVGAASSTTINANGTSSRFKMEKQNSTGRTLPIAVKRVLSIKRSSSVSERYSRIHDQYANPFDDDYDDEQEQEQEEFQMVRSKNKTKKQNKGRILKACKRVFGL